MSLFLPHIDGDKQFYLKGIKLLEQPTTFHIPATIDTTTVDIINHSTSTTTFPLTTPTKAIQNQKKSYQNKLIIHYKHEKRFHSFKRDLHQIDDSIFSITEHYEKT